MLEALRLVPRPAGSTLYGFRALSNSAGVRFGWVWLEAEPAGPVGRRRVQGLGFRV